MKAPDFDYACPRDLTEALDLLDRHGSDAQILAGGQSLMPSLNFRVNTPSLLIDVNRLAELTGIGRTAAPGGSGEMIRIGALTRHAEVERSDLIRREVPLLAEAVTFVAHPAIRNRGTLGGSLCLADPAAELPACAVALGADLVLVSREGRRTVPAASFFKGLFETDLQPGEMLTEILVPLPKARQRNAFLELSRRHGDFAIVGIAAQLDTDVDRVAALRVVVFGCETHARIAQTVAAAAAGRRLDPDLAAIVAAAVIKDLSPQGDSDGDRAQKLHLAQVLARRAMLRLLSNDLANAA